MINKREGISLIVLVITIIIVIILAGGVILTLSANNPISSANEAVFKSDLDAIASDLNMYQSSQYSKVKAYSPDRLNANDLTAEYDGTVIENKTIKDIIPVLSKTDKYNGQFEIINGKLVYLGTNRTQKRWAQDVNVEVIDADRLDAIISTATTLPISAGTDVVATIKISSNASINNIKLTNNLELLDNNNIAVATQPVFEIGTPTGTELDTLRTVEVTIKTDELAEGIYKLKLKSYSISNIYDVTNSKDIVAGELFEIDNTPPANPEMSVTSTGWTNSDVIVSVTYPSDSVKKEYSLDGTTWNTYTDSITVNTNNTTIYSRAIDIAGNQSGQSTMTIVNIDKESPISLFGTNGGNNLQVASTKVTLTDVGVSGLDITSLKYIWDAQNVDEPTGEWTTFVNNEIISKADSNGTYYLWIKALDNAGNSIITKSNAFVVDNIVPENPTLTAIPTAWTNTNVTVTITYPSDAFVKEYSIDGITWNAYTEVVLITTNNTTIYTRATDASGNQSGQSTLTVANIDKIMPTATYVTNGGIDLQTASTVVTASDLGGSNIISLEYIWDTQNSVTPINGWTSFTSGSTITKSGMTGTYYLWIKVVDNAGNILVTKSNAFVADNTPPANPTISASPTAWTNGNVTVTITYPADASVKEYSTNGTTWSVYTAPVVIITNNTTVYARAADMSGNQSGQSTITVANIDKILPTVTYGTNGGTNLKTASTTVIANDLGGSNISSSEYIWDTQNSVTPSSGWTVFTSGNTITKSMVTGSYYLWVKVVDNAGNNFVTKSNVFVLDNTPPINPAMSASPTGWTNGNVTITITYPVDMSVKEYSTNGTTWSAYTAPVVVSTNNTTVYARGSDASGNQSGQSTITVTNIERIAPSVPTVNFNGYTPGTWTSAAITLNLSSTDANSGINKYQWSNNGTTWNDFQSSWIYNYDTAQTPCFRSIDNAGNVSAATSYYNILRDATAPTYTSYSITNITSDTYDVFVYGVSDAGSGVNRVQFPNWTALNGQDDMVSSFETNSTITGQNLGSGTWKYTVKRSDHNNEYGVYLTHLYLYDNLGNVAGFALNNTTLVDASIVAKFTLTAAQEIFNGSTSYYTAGEVSNNYTIEFDAQPSDTIDVFSENNTLIGHTGYKHRFIILESHGGGVPNAGLGVDLGTNGIVLVAHSNGYYHSLLTYYSNLNAWNHYKIVVENKIPRLYINGALIKTGYPPLSSYTKLYTLFSIGTGAYGNYIGRANNFVFYNTVK
ncbi:MAG: hypothetical protein K0R72_1222 [Clostridia bacterium]|jgi:Tfp pilus assembly protein PilE|nr:hypothetical protein [Clostridia bacterium]